MININKTPLKTKIFNISDANTLVHKVLTLNISGDITRHRGRTTVRNNFTCRHT